MINPRNFDIESVLARCAPGVVPTREIEAAAMAVLEAANFDPNAPGAICTPLLAAILPHMADGNPPQYALGAPPLPPVPVPGGTPILAAALPEQPDPATGLFPWGLKRFADSNPTPLDNWSIDNPSAIA